MTETATNFTLGETGSLDSTTNETGNTVIGSYSRTITGSDSYRMTETGTNPASNSFSEVVSGSDNYTLTESGNPANQTFSRGATGNGSYGETMVVTVPGSPPTTTTTTPTGSYSYSLTESADARAGAFSQSQSGGNRYGQLVYFVEVLNTAGGKSPGNMNFYAFGEPFADSSGLTIFDWVANDMLGTRIVRGMDSFLGSYSNGWYTRSGNFEGSYAENLGRRAPGVGRVVGGAFEVSAGAGLLAVPEPTMVTKAWGFAAMLHGCDEMTAGLIQAWTGERTQSLTERAISSTGVHAFGANEQDAQLTAQNWSESFGLVSTLGGTLGVQWLFRIRNRRTPTCCSSSKCGIVKCSEQRRGCCKTPRYRKPHNHQRWCCQDIHQHNQNDDFV